MASRLGPNPVDASVGARIRLRRRVLKVSQERLACDLGLTPQQVQKYERAKNGVSASRLYQIAQSLGAPVAYFFEDLPTTGAEDRSSGPPLSAQTIHAFLMTHEGLELAQLFPLIRSARMRRHLLDLVRDIADGAARPPAALGEPVGRAVAPGR